MRHSLIELGPQCLCFPGREKSGLQLTQRRTAVRSKFQEVREFVERFHDGMEGAGGAELVKEL